MCVYGVWGMGCVYDVVKGCMVFIYLVIWCVMVLVGMCYALIYYSTCMCMCVCVT